MSSSRSSSGGVLNLPHCVALSINTNTLVLAPTKTSAYYRLFRGSGYARTSLQCYPVPFPIHAPRCQTTEHTYDSARKDTGRRSPQRPQTLSSRFQRKSLVYAHKIPLSLTKVLCLSYAHEVGVCLTISEVECIVHDQRPDPFNPHCTSTPPRLDTTRGWVKLLSAGKRAQTQLETIRSILILLQ